MGEVTGIERGESKREVRGIVSDERNRKRNRERER